MSIFASYVTKIVPLPFDDGQTVTIQKLSGKALAACRQASIATSVEFVRSMGGAAFGRELAAVKAAADGAELAGADGNGSDPLRRYDRSLVLAKGVKAWTYSEPLTPEAIDDLDEQAADFLAREILALTLPPVPAEKKTDS
jgi:hypothetical protein